MARSTSADSTRDRIVAAARAEFSRHGIAGARIDRIARAARTSKERLYAYFRSKEALYQYIAGQELAAVAEATRLDPTDLPEYAGRMHDYFVRHPDRLRLMRWGQLESNGLLTSPDGLGHEIVRGKVEQLRQAQEDGYLDPSWDPMDILVFVDEIAASWAGQRDLLQTLGEQVRDSCVASRRAAIVAAVQRLFPAAR